MKTSWSRLLLSALACAAIGTAIGTGCTTESRDVGPRDIKYPASELQKISVSKIFHDGKHAGWLETSRLIDGDSDDRNDKIQRLVLDNDSKKIGVITDDHRAYRFRAHEGLDLVGNHTALENNILAVFGWTSGRIVLEKQVVND